MPHLAVDARRFTRSAWFRSLEDLSPDDAARHLGHMDCISWNVVHLAWHQRHSRPQRPRGVSLYSIPNMHSACGTRMATPSRAERPNIWHTLANAAGLFLAARTSETGQSDLLLNGQSVGHGLGSAARRVTLRYWYDIGEPQAIRQLFGPRDTPEYVGHLDIEAPYRPE